MDLKGVWILCDFVQQVKKSLDLRRFDLNRKCFAQVTNKRSLIGHNNDTASIKQAAQHTCATRSLSHTANVSIFGNQCAGNVRKLASSESAFDGYVGEPLTSTSVRLGDHNFEHRDFSHSSRLQKSFGQADNASRPWPGPLHLSISEKA